MNVARFIAVCLCLVSAQAIADLAWPEPSMPHATQLESMGDELSINGIPVRIFTFTTGRSAENVIEHFREQIDTDLTRIPEKRLSPGTTALGGRHGDFWLTLKVEQLRSGARGTWSATPRFVSDVKQPVVTPAGFPGSAKLIQQVDSYDIGKRSQFAIGLDPSPVDGVARRMEEDLREQGFVKQALPETNWPSPDRYIAVFSKAREELWVTLRQQRAGTSVSINRISALEVLK